MSKHFLRLSTIGGIVIFILILGSTSYNQSSYKQPSETDSPPQESRMPNYTNSDMHRHERDSSHMSDTQFPIDKSMNQPLTFLIVGIDERKHDSGRTDTIIVVTARPDDRTIKTVSIPRDTKTVLADVTTHTYDKINHAYSRGHGIASTRRTVEQFLDITIDYTVSINMDGFIQLVDLFGGVDIEVPYTFTSHGYRYTKGPMTLNGEQALYYVRERTGTSDFNRNERQQDVLRSLIDKASRLSTITKIAQIYHIIDKNVETDLTPWQLFQLQRIYRHISDDDIEHLKLFGTDEWSDAYYFIVADSSRRHVGRTLREHIKK